VYFPGGKPKVQDGPFTEAKELVGGFWMLDVKSKEEAVEWAKRVPVTNTNFVELRQVYEMEDFPEDVQRAADNSTVKAAVEKHARRAAIHSAHLAAPGSPIAVQIWLVFR
jgi:hypothetical protein